MSKTVDRCSQLISDRCTSLLANLIQKSYPVTLDKLSFRTSLKYFIINDPSISVEITSPTSFEIYESHHGLIIADGPSLSQARISDFFLGSLRVSKQYDAVLKLKNAGAPAAWLLISAYYCAFFSCIEICKLLNRVSFSMEDDDIKTLRIKATGKSHAQFFTAPPHNFIGIEYAGKIQFRSSGTKPHATAWDSARLALQDIYSSKGWPDADKLLKILNDSEYSPSKIRNTWNYKRSDFFGTIGETNCVELRKLIGNPEGAAAWLARNRGRIDAQDPCIIAVLCELLSAAVIDAAHRGGELLRQTIS